MYCFTFKEGNYEKNDDHGLLYNTAAYVALRGLYINAILISWEKRKVLFISLFFVPLFDFFKYASLYCNLIKLVNILRKYAAREQKHF